MTISIKTAVSVNDRERPRLPHSAGFFSRVQRAIVPPHHYSKIPAGSLDGKSGQASVLKATTRRTVAVVDYQYPLHSIAFRKPHPIRWDLFVLSCARVRSRATRDRQF